MAFVTSFYGVIFIEGDHPRAVKRFSADTRVGGFGAQLKNLNDLKAQMANTAIANGCNCVVNFTYGQKSKVIAIDDVAFVGGGYYAQLSQEDYNSIISKL
ncbi:MAG: hypothetical protein IKL62_05500 [Clostridia bacterium]|nr:hypothetical protein [Oscillospiraceae bacterium]MBR6694383.1 hypothetical protein [Clostridia bacterium]